MPVEHTHAQREKSCWPPARGGGGRQASSLCCFFSRSPRARFSLSLSLASRGFLRSAASTKVTPLLSHRGVVFCFAKWRNEQAALPQGIVPFVFSKEYNVHPDILSTA